MHHYWHSEGVTDLSKIQDEARDRLVDRRHPEESVVHKHSYDIDCVTKQNRDPATHEFFRLEGPEPADVVAGNMHNREDSIRALLCVEAPIGCGRKIPSEEYDAWDELTRTEYKMSGFCNACQDRIFGPCEPGCGHESSDHA